MVSVDRLGAEDGDAPEIVAAREAGVGGITVGAKPEIAHPRLHPEVEAE